MAYVKKVLKIFAYFFLGLLVSLAIYTFILTDILKKDYVNVFGYSYFVVSTGSMSGTIEVNDIIFVKITKNVHEDEIVTFFNKNRDIITHRVVKIDGNKYITQGDVNNSLDDPVDKNDVIGKVVLIISPSFILKAIAVFIILFIFISLLNFDKIFKKYILGNDDISIEDVLLDDGNDEIKSLNDSLLDDSLSKEEKNKILLQKQVAEEKKRRLLEKKKELRKEFDKKISIEQQLIKELDKERKKLSKTNLNKLIDDKIEEKLKNSPASNDQLSLLITKKIDEKLEAYGSYFESNVSFPSNMFSSNSSKKNVEISTGLTVNIPVDEIEKIREKTDKLVAKDEVEEFLDFNETSLYKKDPYKERDNEICELVINFLRIKNDKLTTTKLNKKWLVKFQYIYKIAYILKINNTDLLVEEVLHPSFKEIYDYDLDKAGLSENFRNKIYDMPIYIFLKILTYAIIYNDEEYFDGIFKIMKYKVQVDRDGYFKRIKSSDSYSKKQLNSLIDFMNKISSDYDNKNVFELKRIEKGVDLKSISCK